MLLVPIKAGSAANSPGLSFPTHLNKSMAGSGKQVALLLPPLGRAAAMRLRLVADARPGVDLAAAAGKEGQQSELRTWQKCSVMQCVLAARREVGRQGAVGNASSHHACAAPCRFTGNTSQSAIRSIEPAACPASVVQDWDSDGGAARRERLHAATPDARCRRGIAGCAPGQGGAELSTVHQFVGLLICNARHESGLGRQACKGKWSS